MTQPRDGQTDYGNWVSRRMIYVPAIIGLIFVGLSFVHLAFLVGALLFFGIAIYFTYSRQQFSSSGGNIQARIRDLVFDCLEWDGAGTAVDIGCGNGPLAIRLAKDFPDAQVVGIDLWAGGMWEYSQEACERNAETEGVGDRVTFQKASASSLPFEDGALDAAVSNNVFHEVSDTPDKRDVIKEALRVVKKGGAFAFQDLFLWKAVYGEVDDLLETIRSWGVEDVRFLATSDLDFIPGALKLPFMTGNIGILYGRK